MCSVWVSEGGWMGGGFVCVPLCLCVRAYVCVCTYMFSGKFSAGNIWIIYMKILYYNENIIMQILAM